MTFMTAATAQSAEQLAAEFTRDIQAIKQQIGRVIVGNEEIIDGVMACMLTGGHDATQLPVVLLGRGGGQLDCCDPFVQ